MRPGSKYQIRFTKPLSAMAECMFRHSAEILHAALARLFWVLWIQADSCPIHPAFPISGRCEPFPPLRQTGGELRLRQLNRAMKQTGRGLHSHPPPLKRLAMLLRVMACYW